MTKRAIAVLLVVALLLTGLPAVVAGAEEYDLDVKQIRVNYAGAVQTEQVLEDRDGTLLAPLSWLCYYGIRQTCSDEGDHLAYYSLEQDQDRDLAKRIFVEKDTGSFTVALYLSVERWSDMVLAADDYDGDITDTAALRFSPTDVREHLLGEYFAQGDTDVRRVYDHYCPLYEGRFSRWIEFGEEFWAPLAELLPLIDVEAAVSEESGELCMQPVVMTFFRAMHEHSETIREYQFSADQIVAKDAMVVGGWIVSTFTGELRNLDIVFDSGRVEDYESLFEQYLVDNEVYLSAYDAEHDPVYDYIRQEAEEAKSIQTAAGAWNEFFQTLDNCRLFEAMGVESDAIPERWERFTVASNALVSMYNYAEVYTNQVEDHRKMLGAVYDHRVELALEDGDLGEALRLLDLPSYRASQTVRTMYDEDAAHSHLVFRETIQEFLWDETGDLIDEKLDELASGKLGPWFSAIKITKLFLEEEYQYVADSRRINLMDNVVDYSDQTYELRLLHQEWNEAEVNDMRLCVMMSLLASRCAYRTYWDGEVEHEIATIDKVLRDIYLAALWKDYDTVDTYEMLYKRYRPEMSHLKTYEVSIADHAEHAMMSMFIEQEGEVWDTPCWNVVDTDGDRYDELVFKFYITDSAYETMTVTLDADADALTWSIVPTEQMHTDYSYSCPDLSSELFYGDPEKLLGQLDERIKGRDGYMFCENTDLDQDGDSDRVYAVYGAGNHWDDLSDGRYLNLSDNNIYLITAISGDGNIRLEVTGLPKQKLDPDTDWDDARLQTVPHESDLCYLTVDGWIYEYHDGDYVFKGFQEPQEEDVSVEQLLDWGIWYLHAVANMEQTDVDDLNWVEGELNGVKIHARRKAGTDRIEMLQIFNDGVDMAIAGEARLSMGFYQLQQTFPLTAWMEMDEPVYEEGDLPAWMGPSPVYGENGIEAYEYSFFWMNSLNEEIYSVVVATPINTLDAELISVTFRLEEDPSWSLYEHLRLLRSRQN